MAGGQTENAAARIEAALSRIERAAQRAAAEKRDLAARHARLRQAVTGSLAEIDQLIAGADR